MAARQGGRAVQGVSDDERWGCPEGQAHDEDMSAGLNLGAACESRRVLGWPAGSAGQTRDAAGALEGSVERETALAVPATLCANGQGELGVRANDKAAGNSGTWHKQGTSGCRRRAEREKGPAP
jgi:hypothetical protein